MKKSKESKVAREITNLSIGGLVILAVATTLGFFATVHPYLDWFVHFRAIYAALALAPLVFLGLRKHPGVLAAAAVLAVNLVAVSPWMWSPVAQADSCTPAATALAINAQGPASDHDALMALIESEDPDVLFVSEIREDLKDRIAEVYPHHVWKPEPFHHFALFTKYPVRGGTYVEGPNGRPTINAVVSTPHGPLRVLGAHPTSPGNAAGSLNRNAMLSQIAELARTSEEPVLLLGDLNTTMFSPFYRPIEEAGMRNARTGRGIRGTWPNYSPIRIPIDHVLVSPELELCDMEVGEDFGSDHLPVRASLRWNTGSPESTELAGHHEVASVGRASVARVD